MRKIKNILAIVWAACFLLVLISACKEDDKDALLPNQGEICFQFTKITTYTLADLDDIATVKIVLEKDGVKIELPSCPLTGNTELLSTEKVRLEEGHYKLLSYRAFGKDANLIENLDITLTEDNEFDVKVGELQEYILPVKVKTVVDPTNNYTNVLFAICKEVLGDDRSKWPPSWDVEETLDTWAGLSFETDDYGNLLYITDLDIDGDGNLPEFKHMKKLSRAIINFPSMTGLHISNCDLEELPDNIGESRIASIYIENTNFSTFPKSFRDMKKLNDLTLINNKVTELPESIGEIKTLRTIDVINEKVSKIPANIVNLTELVSLRFINTEISELPDVFDQLYKISTLDMRNNKNLKSLPPSIANTVIGEEGNRTRKYLRGMLLDGCSFTSIPKEVQHENMQLLSMADNQIQSVTKEELEKMPNLHSLILDGNKLPSFPAMKSDKLLMLSLINCGLKAADIDRSNLPNLRFLFMTQEEYDAVMKGYEVNADYLLK
ncbi:leucine-rich repeat domain-containing protein [Bacteroides nordii]|uniref:leucine-rich repeat domain-containing protein n=1 Tax=Bacteroides nordii TaxID=291645 RepID=UPI00189768B5|nr:leucine-rich repeat domain-containing protein [Bacteroides nordii]